MPVDDRDEAAWAEAEVLWDRVAKGDKIAFTEMVLITEHSLRSWIRTAIGGFGLDIDEIRSETLLRAWRARRTFNHQSSLKTWCFAIAQNEVKRAARAELGYRVRHSTQVRLETLSFPDQQDDVLDTVDLVRALARLDGDHRAILHLRFVEGLAYKDIAEVLNIPIGTVSGGLKRAIRDLRHLVQWPEDL